ncbi:MAG: hypothetical protein RSP_16050 [Rhodanobacter sp.]
MKTTLQFLVFLLMAFAVIVLAILLGDLGAWYFAWLVGTAMIVLIAAAGGVLLDTQDEHAAMRKVQAADGPRA